MKQKTDSGSKGKTDKLYDTLKQRIVSTEYAPGEVLNEQAIAEEFRVSRTPVREALRRLQQEKWLNALPNIGMQVETFDVNQLKDSFNVKEALETLVVKETIDNATDEDIQALWALCGELEATDVTDFKAIVALDTRIHQYMWRVASNSMLNIYLPDIHQRLTRSWIITKRPGANTNKAVLLSTFRDIVRSVENRDKGMAETAVHEHMEHHRNEMRANIL